MNPIARRFSAAALAACAGLAFGAPQRATAAQDVYRCPDDGGSVVYQAEPCREGVRLHLLPGKPDEAAIERLRRDDEAFQRRYAAREALMVEREMRLAQMRASAAREPDYGNPDDAQVYYPAYGGYPGDGYGFDGRRSDRGHRSDRGDGHARGRSSRHSAVPAHPQNPGRIYFGK